jgi:hypothetical protein
MNEQRSLIIKTGCILKKFEIPIYDVVFYLSISDNIFDAHVKLKKYFGDPPQYEYIGLCVRNGSKFALFLQRNFLTVNVLAHEVFHLTNRILEYTDPESEAEYPHEHGSMLHGYLFNLIWNEINKSNRSNKENTNERKSNRRHTRKN